MWTNKKFCIKIHYRHPTKHIGSYFTTSKPRVPYQNELYVSSWGF